MSRVLLGLIMAGGLLLGCDDGLGSGGGPTPMDPTSMPGSGGPPPGGGGGGPSGSQPDAGLARPALPDTLFGLTLDCGYPPDGHADGLPGKMQLYANLPT